MKKYDLGGIQTTSYWFKVRCYTHCATNSTIFSIDHHLFGHYIIHYKYHYNHGHHLIVHSYDYNRWWTVMLVISVRIRSLMNSEHDVDGSRTKERCLQLYMYCTLQDRWNVSKQKWKIYELSGIRTNDLSIQSQMLYTLRHGLSLVISRYYHLWILKLLTSERLWSLMNSDHD